MKFNDLNDSRFKKEIFGPILSLYLYNSKDLNETLYSCTNLTDYKLTGSIFVKMKNIYL